MTANSERRADTVMAALILIGALVGFPAFLIGASNSQAHDPFFNGLTVMVTTASPFWIPALLMFLHRYRPWERKPKARRTPPLDMP